MRDRLLRGLPILLSLTAIAAATLRPQRTSGSWVGLDPLCLICGDRGAADSVLNVLLFVPLGLAIARYWTWLPSLLFGVMISIGVEIIQASIPGRFPTVGDIVWNGTGAGLGAALWHGWRLLLSMPWPGRLTIATAALLCPLVPAVLSAPAPTSEDYFPQWAPAISTGRSYRSRVTRATIADLELRPGRLPDTDSVRAALRRGTALRVSFVAVSPPKRLSPVFRFVDSRSNEIAALGIRGHDLVWTERTVAASLGFGAPPAVWTQAFEDVVPGSEVGILVRRENGAVCMEFDSHERCDIVPTLRDGWELLLPDPGVPAVRVLAGLFWLGVPTLVAGILVGGGLLPSLSTAVIAAAGGAWTAVLPGVRLSAIDLIVLSSAVLCGSAIAHRLRRPEAATYSEGAV